MDAVTMTERRAASSRGLSRSSRVECSMSSRPRGTRAAEQQQNEYLHRD
jgi:hypothetical protein